MRLRIVTCSQGHLDRCIEHKVFGSNSERFTDWRSGDYVVFDVEGAVAALARVRGLPYEEKRRLWSDDLYPFRIPIEPELVLAPAERRRMSDGMKRVMREAWGAQNDASFDSAIQSQRPIAEPHATRILSELRGGPPHTTEEDTRVSESSNETGPERIELRNCTKGDACGRRWDELVKTELPDVRFCTRCERAVYLAAEGDDLLESLRKGRCVAIRL